MTPTLTSCLTSSLTSIALARSAPGALACGGAEAALESTSNQKYTASRKMHRTCCSEPLPSVWMALRPPCSVRNRPSEQVKSLQVSQPALLSWQARAWLNYLAAPMHVHSSDFAIDSRHMATAES